MYKIVHINTFPNKATGSIMFSIHNQVKKIDNWDSFVVGEEVVSPKTMYMNIVCNVDGR